MKRSFDRAPRRVVLALAAQAALVGLAAASPTPASTAASTARPVEFKLHFVAPFAQWLFVTTDGGTDVGGVSVVGLSLSREFDERWAVEIGAASVLTSIQGLGSDAYLRFGWVPVIGDGRGADGHGWTLQLQALAGYRHLDRFDSPDGHDGSEVAHGVQALVGLDFTHHRGGHGFTARILTGLTVPFARSHTGYWASYSYFDPSDDLRRAFDLGLDLGVTL